MIHTGPDVLANYLAFNQVDLHALDLEGFRAWLAARIKEQERNVVFRQMCLIRDIVRRNQRRIQSCTEVLDEARIAFLESTHFEALERLALQIDRLQKGVNGLTIAVNQGRADPQKLEDFKQALEHRQRSFLELVACSPEKQHFDLAQAALGRLREEIGLTREEAHLKNLQRERGRRTGTAGRRFEEAASEVIEQFIRPELLESRTRIECLRRVTLGSARAEFDFLIVGVTPGRTSVDALAVVEAKRNVNDVAAGFRRRQENLAWFTGDVDGYDLNRYRTRFYLTGHFDRLVQHQQDGRDYAFDRNSFQRFRRDPETGYFLSGLYFVAGTQPLVGVGRGELHRILHWVAVDPTFDLANDAVIRRYWQRVLSVIERLQSRAVLEIYHHRFLAQQIVFCSTSGQS